MENVSDGARLKFPRKRNQGENSGGKTHFEGFVPTDSAREGDEINNKTDIVAAAHRHCRRG